jgi:capsular polysaccharide biosynthesis protein
MLAQKFKETPKGIPKIMAILKRAWQNFFKDRKYADDRQLKAPKGFTQKWLTQQAYQQSYPCRWHPVYSAEPTHWHSPQFFGQQQADFAWGLVSSFPELGVLELSHGSVIGKDGWVLGLDNCLLPEFSTYGHKVESITLPESCPPLQSIPGVCLSLVSTWPGNYCHFLLDSIGRFHLFQKAGFSLKDVDAVYCPMPTSDNSKTIFEKLEIPESKRIWSADGVGLQAETLLVPSFPGSRRNYPPWLVDFLQELADFPPVKPHRKLYVTRGSGTRKLLNERSLMPLLEQYGFEFYDPDFQPNQPLDFHQAQAIVAPHGAGCANIAFCQPGTLFLELIPTDHVFTHFYTLAQSAQLNYAYLMGRSVQHRSRRTAPSPYDFSVDEQEFTAALAQFLA